MNSFTGHGFSAVSEDFVLPGNSTGGRYFPYSTASDTVPPPPPSDETDLFFPRFDHLNDPSVIHMTDLTHCLPRNSSATRAFLDRLKCVDDLSSTINASYDAQPDLQADLFSNVCPDTQPVLNSLEPSDVYGRVSCYDGKIILQLRLLCLNTNFPINISECWVCRKKVGDGAQLYTHKHHFNGIIQVNDECISIVFPDECGRKYEPAASGTVVTTSRSLDTQLFATKGERGEGSCSTSRATDNVFSAKIGSMIVDSACSSNKNVYSCYQETATSRLSNLGNVSNTGDSSGTIVSRKVEIGARKRKSKAHKKPSAIRMKGDDSRITEQSPVPVQSSQNVSDAERVALPQQRFDISAGCFDATLLQKSQQRLDENYNMVKKIIEKTEDVACSECATTFGRNLADYEKHMIGEHGVSKKTLYSCPVCFKKFAMNKYLVQHVKTHLGIKAFKCDKCGTTYGREESLKRHLMTHTSTRPHECRICPKSFTRYEYLKAHLQAHNRTRHECALCGVVCSSKFNLIVHSRKHKLEKPFVCELCSKSFVRSDFLDNHMEVVHKRNKPKCKVCGRFFSRKDVLKRHMAIHKSAMFDCKFCLRSFTRKDRLLAHKRTHQLDSELKYTRCPAVFHRREVLLKHERLHETKHQCHICFKFVSTKEKLLIHVESHASPSTKDAKNYHVCETCGKRLTRRELLVKHMRRIHGRAPQEGELNKSKPLCSSVKRGKQFVCEICSKGFTRSCNLRSHVLKAHRAEADHQHNIEDEDDLDSLNTALNKSRSRQQNLIELSSWKKVNVNRSEQFDAHHASFSCGSNYPLRAVSGSQSVLESYKENCSGWYPRSGSASPSTHLPSNLTLPQLSSQHPHSPLNFSAEVITAAASLLAYPSYLGPYQ